MINKNDPEYCEECDYYILLVSLNEKQATSVMLNIKYSKSLTPITNMEHPIVSSVKAYDRHCYSVNVTNVNDNLIITSSIFNGEAELHYNSKSFDNEDSSNWVQYALDADNTLKLTPNDLWKGDKDKQFGEVYVCIKGFSDTSYLLRIFLESKIERSQNFNFLFNSVHTNGFLPSGNATKYRVIDFSNSENVTIVMTKKAGNPILYGYICEDIRKCYFTKDIITETCKYYIIKISKNPR